ncbi:MAG: hypothetical protein AAGJ37_13865, partial [Pseudomonadota bacterium]
FAKASEQTERLGWSFFIKWLVWILCFLVFFIANNQHNKRKEKEQILSESSHSVISKFMGKAPKSERTASDKKDSSSADGKDPFDHLRKKEKLRSYAEVIIDSHEKNNS